MRSARALQGTVILLSLCAPAAAIHPATGGAVVGAADAPSGTILDLDGHPLNPFAPAGVAGVIFFIATDCPVSNSYAPEIQGICRDYKGRGVGCSLMYEDVDLGPSVAHLDDEVRKHVREYRYSEMSVAIDRSRVIAKHARASVTPQAIVVDRTGKIRYRGRIDNFYASLGKTRRQVTEHDLRDALDAVLSGRPVPRAETDALGCYIVDPSQLRK